ASPARGAGLISCSRSVSCSPMSGLFRPEKSVVPNDLVAPGISSTDGDGARPSPQPRAPAHRCPGTLKLTENIFVSAKIAETAAACRSWPWRPLALIDCQRQNAINGQV